MKSFDVNSSIDANSMAIQVKLGASNCLDLLLGGEIMKRERIIKGESRCLDTNGQEN